MHTANNQFRNAIVNSFSNITGEPTKSFPFNGFDIVHEHHEELLQKAEKLVLPPEWSLLITKIKGWKKLQKSFIPTQIRTKIPSVEIVKISFQNSKPLHNLSAIIKVANKAEKILVQNCDCDMDSFKRFFLAMGRNQRVDIHNLWIGITKDYQKVYQFISLRGDHKYHDFISWVSSFKSESKQLQQTIEILKELGRIECFKFDKRLNVPLSGLSDEETILTLCRSRLYNAAFNIQENQSALHL